MAALPEPWKSLRRALEFLSERVKKLENTSPFSGTGLSIPEPGTTQVTGNLWVTGDFTADGKINNDALTNPVIPGSVWQTAQDFTVSPAWSTVISFDVTVPAGVTSAAIDGKGRVTAFYNQGVSTDVDYLYAHLWVGSDSSDFYPLAVTGAGGSGTNQVFRDTVLTGLTPGGTINFLLQASTDFNTWSTPSSPGNRAKLGASISWYR